jgi:nucleoid-associated protein YgaU
VQKGDTLYRLAEKYYGSGRQWQVLADANKDRVGPNGMLREGTRLRVPNPTADAPRQESPRAAPAGAKPGRSLATSPKAPETRVARAKTYTVRKDDTLSEISRRALGTSRRWREISELNGIDDEELLTPGMVLRLPG